MRITRYGHACLLVETAGARLLVDPGTFSHGFEELTGLDAVLVTHQHPDHLDVERLPQLLEANDGAQLLAEAEAAAELRHAGVDEVRSVHAGDVLDVAGVEVEAVGGRHAVIHDDIPRIGNVGLLVRGAGEPVLLHPGDSFATAPDGVDVLALPVNAPWAALKEGVEFLRAVSPRVAVPVHDGLLAEAGRAVYLRQLRALGPESTEHLDPAHGEVVELRG